MTIATLNIGSSVTITPTSGKGIRMNSSSFNLVAARADGRTNCNNARAVLEMSEPGAPHPVIVTTWPSNQSNQEFMGTKPRTFTLRQENSSSKAVITGSIKLFYNEDFL